MGTSTSEVWCGTRVERGQRANVSLSVSESYLGATTSVPVHVWCAPEPGPHVLVTGAVHGDEINGTGTIRSLLADPPFELESGTLVLVPVVNVPGFVRHERYMPDRRDLNRGFPGSSTGSTTSRLARVMYDELVKRCDYCIDLHTAAVRRTNYPNVRADLSIRQVRRIARAFGAEVLLDSTGPDGSMRRVACDAGCATMILEAGETGRVEPTVVEFSLRGIRNVLIELGMVSGKPERAAFRCVASATKWVRASSGGFLQFHCTPGDLIEEGAPIATNTTLLGEEIEVLMAPVSGIVIGQTTLPSVAPGDPVVHIAIADPKALPKIEQALDDMAESSLGGRLRSDLGSSFLIVEEEETISEDEDDTE